MYVVVQGLRILIVDEGDRVEVITVGAGQRYYSYKGLY